MPPPGNVPAGLYANVRRTLATALGVADYLRYTIPKGLTRIHVKGKCIKWPIIGLKEFNMG